MPHEASFLKLDCNKVKATFGWQPRWHIEECIQKTIDFNKVWLNGDNLAQKMDEQIEEFFGGNK